MNDPDFVGIEGQALKRFAYVGREGQTLKHWRAYKYLVNLFYEY